MDLYSRLVANLHIHLPQLPPVVPRGQGVCILYIDVSYWATGCHTGARKCLFSSGNSVAILCLSSSMKLTDDQCIPDVHQAQDHHIARHLFTIVTSVLCGLRIHSCVEHNLRNWYLWSAMLLHLFLSFNSTTFTLYHYSLQVCAYTMYGLVNKNPV